MGKGLARKRGGARGAKPGAKPSSSSRETARNRKGSSYNQPLDGDEEGGDDEQYTNPMCGQTIQDSSNLLDDEYNKGQDHRSEVLYTGKLMLLVVVGFYAVVLGGRFVKKQRNMNSSIRFAGANTKAASSTTSGEPIIYHQDVTGKSKIVFSKDRPLISLSLPNSGTNILPRYFKCGGKSQEFGRYWTTLTSDMADRSRRPIGDCMRSNLQAAQPLLQGCGDDKYSVWHDLQFQAGPIWGGLTPDPNPKCFDLVLHATGLTKLAEMFPTGGTILNTIRDPQEWYASLSYDQHKIWSVWCNPSHGDAFPTEHTETAYLAFYDAYHLKLRQFVIDHPTWKLLEIELRQSASDTANYLESRLSIPSKCWMEASSGVLPLYDIKGEIADTPKALVGGTTLPRPNDIAYPVFALSLPRSGTGSIRRYFQCQMGVDESMHQTMISSVEPHKLEMAGLCYKHNVEQSKPPLEGCGDARVFSALGVHKPDPGAEECYYPDIQAGQLEAFAEAYPHGTLLLTVRTAKSWRNAIERWSSLHARWSSNKKCQALEIFPPPGSAGYIWEQFYEKYVDRIRTFAKHHPTITYLELPLTDGAGPILDDIFGVREGCFGHEGKNQNKT